MHIPDGVLPLWIVLLGWAIAAGAVLLAVRSLAGEKVGGRLALVGVIAAFMLVVQSVPLLPMGYHLNLTVLSGIVLGPALGLIAAFIVNLILALFGHGGVTVVGLNTLVFGVEVMLGVSLFRALHTVLRGSLGSGLAAGGATLLSLLASTGLMLGIVAAAGVALGWQVHDEPARLVLPSSFADAPMVEVPGP